MEKVPSAGLRADILLNKELMVKRNVFMFCRPSTEKLSIGSLATLTLKCEAGLWPPDMKSFFNMVLGYGTFGFESMILTIF